MTETVKVELPEQVISNKRLGRHVEHDPRSKEHRFEVELVGTLKTVHHRRHGGPLDQGNLGSCTGNAAAGAINTEPLHAQHGYLLRERDAVSLYELATQLDEFEGAYPPDDTGSSGLAVAKAAVQRGYITAYKHAFGIDEALAALQVAPVITGVNWYEGFDHPDSNGGVQLSGQIRGGHEFEVIGFQAARSRDEGILIAENSWGHPWGRNGRFHFTVKVWAQLLEQQGDVTILIK